MSIAIQQNVNYGDFVTHRESSKQKRSHFSYSDIVRISIHSLDELPKSHAYMKIKRGETVVVCLHMGPRNGESHNSVCVRL